MKRLVKNTAVPGTFSPEAAPEAITCCVTSRTCNFEIGSGSRSWGSPGIGVKNTDIYIYRSFKKASDFEYTSPRTFAGLNSARASPDVALSPNLIKGKPSLTPVFSL